MAARTYYLSLGSFLAVSWLARFALFSSAYGADFAEVAFRSWGVQMLSGVVLLLTGAILTTSWARRHLWLPPVLLPIVGVACFLFERRAFIGNYFSWVTVWLTATFWFASGLIAFIAVRACTWLLTRAQANSQSVRY